jgi:predicted metal-dependent RNase
MAIETLRVYEQFLIYMDDRVRRAFLFNNINPFRWEALRLFRSISERKQTEREIIRRNKELAIINQIGTAISTAATRPPPVRGRSVWDTTASITWERSSGRR